MKYLVLTLAVLVTGCASQGDLDKLDARLSVTESSQTKLTAELQKCHSRIASLEDKVLKCEEHCKRLDSKLDKVFKKSQFK